MSDSFSLGQCFVDGVLAFTLPSTLAGEESIFVVDARRRGFSLGTLIRVITMARYTHFTPPEFLLRLCALVPPRGFHMVRYHGIFGAHARGRHGLTGSDRSQAPMVSPDRARRTAVSPAT